jgi:hypothetical protein
MALRPLFTATILIGSFLLFLIQPLFGRLVLPVLGGAPNVWTTAMLFYQAALLGGYLYAHALQRWPVRRQLWVHGGLLLLAGITLPIGLVPWYPAADGQAPTMWLIGLLAASIGPVFFAVSAQAPLMQAWFARSDDPAAANPWFLYAASNLGSFAALIAYPLLVEPLAALPVQVWGWSAGFVVLVLLVLVAGWRVGAGPPPPPAARAPITPAQRLRWVLLSGIASALLLSTTTHLTTDIMAMPLLWVVPLALYLLSFVLAFGDAGPRLTAMAVRVAPFALVLLGGWACLPAGPGAAMAFAGAGLLLLLIIAVALHGTLALEKPPADALTSFYMWLSVGGALGGVLCALVAPRLLPWPFEHPLLLVAAALALPAGGGAALWQRPTVRAAGLLLAMLLAAGVASRFQFNVIDRQPGITAISLAGAALLALLVLAMAGRPRLFAGGLALLLLGLGGANQLARTARGEIARSFFGVYTVEDRPSAGIRVLLHGTTLHGVQSLDPALVTRPTTYYTPESGIGRALAAVPALYGPGSAIAAVGLGTGTLACHARPDQRWTAYEIDPLVVAIARQRFSYISRCKPDMAMITGDARLTLAAAPRGGYRLIAVDAFSSDAIPLHLITREAFAVYGRALSDDGLLLVHISNRFLDLEPVVAAIAADGGWQARLLLNRPQQGPAGTMEAQSVWIALSRAPRPIATLAAADPRWRPLEARPGLAPWRDDFASVLPVLRWRK